MQPKKLLVIVLILGLAILAYVNYAKSVELAAELKKLSVMNEQLQTGNNPESIAEAKAIIEREGGKVGSAVTRGTDFLVAGNAPGSKLMRAREMGIRIIGEAEFYQMLDGR